MDYLVSAMKVSQAFKLGHSIIFENHPYALSELDEEVMER